MSILNLVSMLLVIIGGLNWGLVGLADLDIVIMIFGVGTFLTKAIYGLVGLSAIYQLIGMKSLLDD